MNLRINEGDFVVVCGDSGSGKTTLLRRLKPIISPNGSSEGRLLWNGSDIADSLSEAEQATKIGWVMQSPDNQIVCGNVREELCFGLENIGAKAQLIERKTAEMAGYFGLERTLDMKTFQLSGGQKQLLSLASIMAMNPEILILDEPTSQLDPIAAQDFLTAITRLNRDFGITVIITEHRLEDIFAAADMAVIMEKGRVICAAPPPETVQFLAEQNHHMLRAMPAPARVFNGVLTVREARKKLAQMDIHFDSGMAESGSLIIDSHAEKTITSGKADIKKIKSTAEIDSAEKTITTSLPKSEETEKSVNFGENIAIETFAPAEAAITLKNVWFRYEKNSRDILKGVSTAIPAAKITAILGGNGGGKSTLLKVICGVEKHYAGKIRCEIFRESMAFGERCSYDDNVYNLSANSQSKPHKIADCGIKKATLGKIKNGQKERNGVKIAMLPQNPALLFSRDTVLEDLLEAGERSEVERIAALLRVDGLLLRNSGEVSGGELQRLAIVKVLLRRPSVLLLDEPTKGLDSAAKSQLVEILTTLKAAGITIVIVSHDIEFCGEYADFCAMLFDGKLSSLQPPSIFFSDNTFYTTAAAKIASGYFQHCVTVDCLKKRLSKANSSLSDIDI